MHRGGAGGAHRRDAASTPSVLVQAFGAYTYDNSYVVDSAAARPDRFVSIAIVDAEDPDIAGAR